MMVFKEPSAEPSSPGGTPLPDAVLTRPGNAVVDYEGFVVARLPASEADALAETAWSLGLLGRYWIMVNPPVAPARRDIQPNPSRSMLGT